MSDLDCRDLYCWRGPTDQAHDYAHVGKDRRQLDAELRAVAVDTRKRTNNRLDIEDQQARAANLREARGRLN